MQLSPSDVGYLQRSRTDISGKRNLYAALLRISRAARREPTPEALCREVCRAAVDSAGFLLAWIGWHDPVLQLIVPAERYGDHQHYVEHLAIPTDARPEANGPAGLAFRTGKPYVCNDFSNDPITEPWRSEARRAGIRACAAFPIHPRAASGGVLIVYSDEAGYFQAGEVALVEEAAVDIAFAMDVFARDEERRVAKESVNRMAAIIESTQDAIIGKSLDGVITSWNPAAESLLGYSPAEAIGRNITMLIPPERIDEEPQILARIANGERITDFETVRIRKDGGHLPVSLTISLVKSDEGVILGASKVLRNITARKEAANVLEQRVRERTSELAVAKDHAESADRLKSAFLATMSHELRTPLNSIIGFTGILLQGLAGPLNAEQSKQLGMVRSSARHLLSLINDVLDISKIEAGQMEIHAAPFDLRASVEKVFATLAPMAAQKNLHLRLAAPPELGILVSDQRRVEQVLINLLHNAIKFTDQGEIGLSVELLGDHRLPGAIGTQACVRFRVDDTGTGIEASDMEHLFKPFQQLDSGLTRRHDGTGLGLAICYRLVELLRGEIHAQSRFGVGSAFIFTIPGPGPGPSKA